jgi:hypothetical protein
MVVVLHFDKYWWSFDKIVNSFQFCVYWTLLYVYLRTWLRIDQGAGVRINYPYRNRQECELGGLSTTPMIDGLSENIYSPPGLFPKANRINLMFVKCLIPKMNYLAGDH